CGNEPIAEILDRWGGYGKRPRQIVQGPAERAPTRTSTEPGAGRGRTTPDLQLRRATRHDLPGPVDSIFREHRGPVCRTIRDADGHGRFDPGTDTPARHNGVPKASPSRTPRGPGPATGDAVAADQVPTRPIFAFSPILPNLPLSRTGQGRLK